MKVFLDDERSPEFLERFGFTRSEYVDMVVVRSSAKMIEHVKEHGVPTYISFDHDLGGDDNARVFIKWLIDELIDGRVKMPKDFDFVVHSMNPVGSEWICDTMTGIIGEFRGED